MTDSFWRKVSLILGYVTIGVLFGLLVFMANVEIKDYDLWLHLKTGEFIVQNGYVPDKDMLSCTITGNPWVNHEWLFQIFVYLIYSGWGTEGLLTMQALVVTFTFMILLFLGFNKDRQFVPVFILLLVLLVHELRFTIRPDIFSGFFFVLYIYILSMHIGQRTSIFALFVIQVLWCNFHGFFFLGPLLILVGIISEFIKRHIRLPYQWNEIARLSDDEYSRLKLILGVVILACLFNPLTFKGAWYPIDVLLQISGESRVFFERIQELQRPISWHTIFSLNEVPYYKLLIWFSFASFVVNRRRIDIGAFLFWLVMLSFSLVALRNLIFFAFIAYLVCTINFLDISFDDILPFHFGERKFQYITAGLLKILLSVWMINRGLDMSYRGYFDYDKYERKSEFRGISQRNYPNKAADFFVQNDVRGNFFNDFNSGAYLIGRCFPNIKVFIDGRTEVYGPEFFEKYIEIWQGKNLEVLDQMIEKHHITGAFLNSTKSHINKDLLNHFYEFKDWVVVYFDYDGVILLRNVPRNEELINKFAIDLSKWKAKEMDLLRLGSITVTPYRHTNRAYTLESLGFHDAALEEVQEALRISPGFIESYKILGKIYEKKEEYMKSFENYRIATMVRPSDNDMRLSLALSYEKLGDFKNAIKQCEKIIKRAPKKAKVHFRLSRAYLKDQQYDKALNILKKAHNLDPKNVKDLMGMGGLFYEQGKIEMSREVYEMALTTEKELAAIHNELGIIFKASGDNISALEEFEKALEIEPDNREAKANIKKIKEEGDSLINVIQPSIPKK